MISLATQVTNSMQIKPQDQQFKEISNSLEKYSRSPSQEESNFINDQLLQGLDVRIIDRESILTGEKIGIVPINKQIASLYLRSGIKYTVDEALADKQEPLKTEFISAIESLFDDNPENPAISLLDTMLRYRSKNQKAMEVLIHFSSRAPEPTTIDGEYCCKNFSFSGSIIVIPYKVEGRKLNIEPYYQTFSNLSPLYEENQNELYQYVENSPKQNGIRILHEFGHAFVRILLQGNCIKDVSRLLNEVNQTEIAKLFKLDERTANMQKNIEEFRNITGILPLKNQAYLFGIYNDEKMLSYYGYPLRKGHLIESLTLVEKIFVPVLLLQSLQNIASTIKGDSNIQQKVPCIVNIIDTACEICEQRVADIYTPVDKMLDFLMKVNFIKKEEYLQKLNQNRNAQLDILLQEKQEMENGLAKEFQEITKEK